MPSQKRKLSPIVDEGPLKKTKLSNNVLAMKFMQRAAAKEKEVYTKGGQQNTSKLIPETQKTKQKLDPTIADIEAAAAAAAEKEQARVAAIEKQAEASGERWFLNFVNPDDAKAIQNQSTLADGTPVYMVSQNEIDRDSSDDEMNDLQRYGRMQFGKRAKFDTDQNDNMESIQNGIIRGRRKTSDGEDTDSHESGSDDKEDYSNDDDFDENTTYYKQDREKAWHNKRKQRQLDPLSEGNSSFPKPMTEKSRKSKLYSKPRQFHLASSPGRSNSSPISSGGRNNSMMSKIASKFSTSRKKR
jgi:hypothetical protein